MMGEAGFAQALRHRLVRDTAREVIREPGRSLTGGDLLRRADAIAAWLVRQPGCADIPTLGLALHRNSWMIAAALACWRLGKTALFLDPRLSPADAKGWLRRAGPLVILASQARLRDVDAAVLLLPDPDDLPLAGFTPCHPLANQIAEFITSSGVSGEPKLIPLDQRRLLDMALEAARDGRRGPWGQALSPLSVAFGGSRHIWWRNLLAGKRIHAMELLFSIPELDRALRRPEVEECSLPPHLIRALLDHAARDPGPVPRYPHLLKLQSIGGPAPVADKLAAQARLCPGYLMTYSSTETGVISHISGADLQRKPASCGRISLPSGGGLDIVDPDGTVLPPGRTGRIRVTRPPLGDGVSRQAFPGDHGWLDGEGFLFVAGRGEGIICRYGVNFSADVLEAKLMSSGLLRAVAVLPLRDAAREDGLAIAVLPLDLAAKGIGPALRRHLVSHEQPEHLIRLAPADLTAGGKIPRAALVERLRLAPQDLTFI
ncbi:class I adenylate-forming enzyme family protein [Paracoccus sp. KR1-242]|uniref:class I adenylate-forming enzyme family protein n=1 Tax=Paracoccus sp. KR1-242 TaxID=3410028 RepID=UPI003BFCEE47